MRQRRVSGGRIALDLAAGLVFLFLMLPLMIDFQISFS
jgi:hypothetical protein